MSDGKSTNETAPKRPGRPKKSEGNMTPSSLSGPSKGTDAKTIAKNTPRAVEERGTATIKSW